MGWEPTASPKGSNSDPPLSDRGQLSSRNVNKWDLVSDCRWVSAGLGCPCVIFTSLTPLVSLPRAELRKCCRETVIASRKIVLNKMISVLRTVPKHRGFHSYISTERPAGQKIVINRAGRDCGHPTHAGLQQMTETVKPS